LIPLLIQKSHLLVNPWFLIKELLISKTCKSDEKSNHLSFTFFNISFLRLCLVCVLQGSNIYSSMFSVLLSIWCCTGEKRNSENSFLFLFIYEGRKSFMASASSSKSPCATCENKSVGIFKCDGCSKTFCRKHSNEHRDSLIHQLDEIVLEHDTLH
jgi:hypothetical protein